MITPLLHEFLAERRAYLKMSYSPSGLYTALIETYDGKLFVEGAFDLIASSVHSFENALAKLECDIVTATRSNKN
jgi:hypothetical protein